jgi:hypothetical protein
MTENVVIEVLVYLFAWPDWVMIFIIESCVTE